MITNLPNQSLRTAFPVSLNFITEFTKLHLKAHILQYQIKNYINHFTKFHYQLTNIHYQGHKCILPRSKN
jgi:hypothetical protein